MGDDAPRGVLGGTYHCRMGVVYEERMIKLALVLSTGVELKNEAVHKFGIGEDINQCLYGWRNNELVVVSRMTNLMKRTPHANRFVAISEAAAIMRQGWGIDEITMIAEGYISDDPVATNGTDLAKEFANGNTSVREGITILHVVDREVSFVTKAYSYLVPKSVEWSEETFVPGKQRITGDGGAYPALFAEALDLSVSAMGAVAMIGNFTEFYDGLAIAMITRGFETKSLV